MPSLSPTSLVFPDGAVHGHLVSKPNVLTRGLFLQRRTQSKKSEVFPSRKRRRKAFMMEYQLLLRGEIFDIRMLAERLGHTENMRLSWIQPIYNGQQISEREPIKITGISCDGQDPQGSDRFW
jgi:hypothetical protein